jgi:hypothetical protein
MDPLIVTQRIESFILKYTNDFNAFSLHLIFQWRGVTSGVTANKNLRAPISTRKRYTPHPQNLPALSLGGRQSLAKRPPAATGHEN